LADVAQLPGGDLGCGPRGDGNSNEPCRFPE
jgi:hypothetical protein